MIAVLGVDVGSGVGSGVKVDVGVGGIVACINVFVGMVAAAGVLVF